MFRAEIDKSRGLLRINVAGDVKPEEARACLDSLPAVLLDMPPGFRLLSDLSGIESISTSTAPVIGEIMELCSRKGIESVVRILPREPRNDIGYAIMSQFHYGRNVHIVTCDNLAEAEEHLAG